MKKRELVKLDAILAELERHERPSNEQAGQTTAELADAWDMSMRQADRIVGLANKAGVLRIGKARRTTRTGISRLQHVYWFEMPKRKKK